MIRSLNIDPALVHSCDVSALERLFGDLAKEPEHARQLQGCLILTFEEFEHPNEPVFLVPQVKAFLKKAHEKIRHLWYFLAADPEINNLLIFLAVHASPEAVMVSEERVSVQPEAELLALLADRMAATAKFSEQMADDTRAIISRITSALPNSIQAPLLAEIFGESAERASRPSQPSINQQFLGPLESMLLTLETKQVPLMAVAEGNQQIFVEQISSLIGGTVLRSMEAAVLRQFQKNIATADHLFLVIQASLRADLYDHIRYYLESRDTLEGLNGMADGTFPQISIHPDHRLILVVDRHVLQSESLERQRFLSEFCSVIAV